MLSSIYTSVILPYCAVSAMLYFYACGDIRSHVKITIVFLESVLTTYLKVLDIQQGFLIELVSKANRDYFLKTHFML